MDSGIAENILRITQSYAQIVLSQIPVEAVYLFGSCVKGTNTQDSDIDIAVVSNAFTGDPVEDRLLLMKMRRNIDLRIEPHPLSAGDVFLREVMSTGVRII